MEYLGAVHVDPESKMYDKVKNYLTIPVHNVGTGESTDLVAYAEDESGVYIPRVYAGKLGLGPDFLCQGDEIPDGIMQAPTYRDNQVPLVDGILSLFEHLTDVVAEAYTGSGKTVCALGIGRTLGRKMLIVVDQEFLRDQWIETAKNIYGVPEEYIGTVQGPKCDYEGKHIVVGMIQSMYQKDYPTEFYESFGLAIFDESHTVGAPQFSKVLLNIPARYRLAVSATPDRTDELNKVIDANLGPVAIRLANDRKKSKLRYIEYSGNSYSWYANTSPKTGRYISEVAEDGERNLLLVQVIKEMYETGRAVLAVSDRTLHLAELRALLIYAGVPEEVIGVVSGVRHAYAWAKEQPNRKLKAHEEGTVYTPVSYRIVEKKTPKALLNKYKEESSIILATYGMFEKGVDAPRLGAGVDCTPRSKAEQVHGRILRKHKGKKVPVWVTIRDTQSPRAEYQLQRRLGDYIKSNVEISEWHLERGLRQVQAEDLQVELSRRVNALKSKEVKIVTKPDGRSIVVTPTIGRVSKVARGRPTVGRSTVPTRSRTPTRTRN